MTVNHGAQIKNDEQYEALRRKGNSKEKAARIANSGRQASERGGKARKYEHWTKVDLLQKARQIGINGRSKMNKSQLVSALRGH